MPRDLTDLEARVKPEVFSLAGLITWLETQPPKKTYCYMDSGACLLHQYFTAMGVPVAGVGGHHWRDRGGNLHPFEDGTADFNSVSVLEPRTFGAALKRARKLAGIGAMLGGR